MTVEYLLGDHLGSTSLTTDKDGAKLSEIRYTAWGNIRYSWTSGAATTPAYKLNSYTFTGQYSYMDDPTTSGTTEGFGLMFYNARWYDPYLNHFTQPDTIVPNPYNPQTWDRYSYARNNPIRYNDPTGHDVDCGLGDPCEELVRQTLQSRYNWKLEGRWSLNELDTIYQTGRDIETYVDGLTDGNGQEWMNEYLGGISISHHGDGRASSSWPWKQIHLGETWLSGYGGGDSWTPKQLFAHELGHTWDMSSGNYLGIGGGVGDDLIWAVWGDPRTSLRFWRYKGGDPAIPSNAYWNVGVNGGYGNGSINDYAAEAFSWSIYNPSNLPFGADGIVSMVVDQTIKFQASNLP
jgi:RHS repeat-associated protein